MTVTSAMLGASQALRDMLWPFEFTVTDNQSHGPVWIDVTALQPFEVVGQNGSGGIFALVGDIKHVLHLTSEGQAGIVAASLQEFLELVVEHPWWEQIASACDGDVAAMRAMLDDEGADLDADAIDNDPAIETNRPLLQQQLGLGIPADPFGLLHHALVTLGAAYDLRDLDGQPMELLFGCRPEA
ncbi:hypothetical protein [Tardiphaga sp. 285_C5_N1_2]|uniref:hypothetical protein n=1 Tax=Tardiphaga sp. 285_C5_N1_2 TaxID=3240775 RepID=UPI003F8AEBAA